MNVAEETSEAPLILRRISGSNRHKPGTGANTEMDRNLFLVAFLSFCISGFFYYFGANDGVSIFKIPLIIGFVVLAAVHFGKPHAAAAIIIIALFSVVHRLLPYSVVVDAHLAMLSLALYFIHKDVDKVLADKITKRKELYKSGLHALGLLFLMVVAVLALSYFMLFLGIRSDALKVYSKVAELPLYVVLFAVLFAPLSEELLFRGFLAARYGIAASAALFALSHLFYGSLSEIAGAFVIGLILAYYFRKERNLLTCIIAHALFNAASLTLMFITRLVAG